MSFQGKRVVSFMPVRGGSKGIPKKNMKKFAGRPLMVYSIEAAKEAKCLDRVITITENEELGALAAMMGSEIYSRPAELGNDTAPIEPSYIQTVERLIAEGDRPDICVLLHATCPLRTGEHIDAAVKQLVESGADSLLTVSRPHAFYWEKNAEGWGEANYDFYNRPNRQVYKAQFKENPAIYVTTTDQLLKGRNRLGGKVSLFEIDHFGAFDIDEIWDFDVAETLLDWQRRLHPKF